MGPAPRPGVACNRPGYHSALRRHICEMSGLSRLAQVAESTVEEDGHGLPLGEQGGKTGLKKVFPPGAQHGGSALWDFLSHM